MSNNCDGCDYNVDDYCIMFDDVLGFEDCVFRSVDENLLKGYHEQSLKHKEAKEKMEREDERMEASALIDVVFYWNGYIKALEELKEEQHD